MATFDAFERKMTAAGMGDAPIRAFRRNYEALLRDETGLIPEQDIVPATDLTSFEDLAAATAADLGLLEQAVVIKLNGGLGTSMGLQGPKCLLPIREGVNFLDLMVRQILDLRQTSSAQVRLLLMNSFSTSRETLEHLAHCAGGAGILPAASIDSGQDARTTAGGAGMLPAASIDSGQDARTTAGGAGILPAASIDSGQDARTTAGGAGILPAAIDASAAWLADPAQVELMQNQIPKIDAATLAPVTWPADPALEWCPPGHGDLYPALVGSGWLDRLLGEGIRYAFVSNSDNLGASLDPALLKYFAHSGAPLLMEVTRRTAADRKGGHLALRKSDGRLLLREVAQCPDADLDAFQDIERHRYFNTNSLWLRLDLLKAQLAEDAGVLPLPMIRNRKTVDPRDKTSPAVIQLETAMGAAIECFAGATAIAVPRSRFAPVKNTADLLALRSDAYEILDNGQVRLHPDRHGVPPLITLCDDYKLIEQLDALGVPSLRHCRSLTITGPAHFPPGSVLTGDVTWSGPTVAAANE